MLDNSQFTPSDIPSDASVGPTSTVIEETANPISEDWRLKCSELVETAKIAMIDDEEMNIEVVQGYLEQEGYRNFFRTTDARRGIELVSKVDPDVVLLDVMMPHVSGLEILADMRLDPHMSHIPVIVLTACTGSETKLQALRLGPSDFLAKPVDPSELLLRLQNVLAVKSYQDHLANYSHDLEEQVSKRTRQLVESRLRIIHCLARAAEFRDDDTGHHVIRVGKYVAVIARALGFGKRYSDLMEQAAQLHDIGKIGVPDSVLLKPGKLSPEEFDQIKQHCNFGISIINARPIGEVPINPENPHRVPTALDADGYPVMELAAIIAQTHHEKWDGSGYPLGLKGKAIPIEGRITAVADVFDALSSARPYKPAFSREKSCRILLEGRGSHFDPRVLDAFLGQIEEILRIQQRYADVDAT